MMGKKTRMIHYWFSRERIKTNTDINIIYFIEHKHTYIIIDTEQNY